MLRMRNELVDGRFEKKVEGEEQYEEEGTKKIVRKWKRRKKRCQNLPY